MANFDFLKNESEYILFANAAIEAEKVYATSPAMSAVGSRKALELAVKWVYSADSGMQMPYKDNLQSLIHGIIHTMLIEEARKCPSHLRFLNRYFKHHQFFVTYI